MAEADEEEEEEENVRQAIIILHPGSSTLHLGLSTDPTPHSIPHIIAYRNVQEAGAGGTENGSETPNGMENRLKSVDESLVLKYSVDMTVSTFIRYTQCHKLLIKGAPEMINFRMFQITIIFCSISMHVYMLISLIQPETEIQREEGLASIMTYLDDCRVAASMINYNIDRAEYVSHNGRVQPVARDSDDLTLTDVTAKPKFVIGNDVSF